MASTKCVQRSARIRLGVAMEKLKLIADNPNWGCQRCGQRVDLPVANQVLEILREVDQLLVSAYSPERNSGGGRKRGAPGTMRAKVKVFLSSRMSASATSQALQAFARSEGYKGSVSDLLTRMLADGEIRRYPGAARNTLYALVLP